MTTIDPDWPRMTSRDLKSNINSIFSRDEIKALWETLQKELDERRKRLNRTIELQKIFQNIILLNDSIEENKKIIQSHVDSNLLEGFAQNFTKIMNFENLNREFSYSDLKFKELTRNKNSWKSWKLVKIMLENFRKSWKFMKIVKIDENREDS